MRAAERDSTHQEATVDVDLPNAEVADPELRAPGGPLPPVTPRQVGGEVVRSSASELAYGDAQLPSGRDAELEATITAAQRELDAGLDADTKQAKAAGRPLTFREYKQRRSQIRNGWRQIQYSVAELPRFENRATVGQARFQLDEARWKLHNPHPVDPERPKPLANQWANLAARIEWEATIERNHTPISARFTAASSLVEQAIAFEAGSEAGGHYGRAAAAIGAAAAMNSETR